jgi:hypothetical protein
VHAVDGAFEIPDHFLCIVKSETPFFFFFNADMGKTYSKPYKTLIGFALSVVESATAVCVGKQKDGLPLVLFIQRLFSQPCLLSLSLNVYFG